MTITMTTRTDAEPLVLFEEEEEKKGREGFSTPRPQTQRLSLLIQKGGKSNLY
jgi:hypothetical protein